jgi:hypothetical protein
MGTEQWGFLLAGDNTWTWRRVDGSHVGTSAPFSDYSAVVANATTRGFDPISQAWTIKANGRTMHFQSGKLSVNTVWTRALTAPNEPGGAG